MNQRDPRDRIYQIAHATARLSIARKALLHSGTFHFPEVDEIMNECVMSLTKAIEILDKELEE